MAANLTSLDNRPNTITKSSKGKRGARMARVETLSNGSMLEALESRMLLSITAVADAPVLLDDGSRSYTIHLVADGFLESVNSWGCEFHGAMGQVQTMGVATPSLTFTRFLSQADQAKDSHLLFYDNEWFGLGLPVETDTSLKGSCAFVRESMSDLPIAQIVVRAGGTVVMSGVASNPGGERWATDLILGETPANFAPILNSSTTFLMSLDDIVMDVGNNPGTLVSTLLASSGLDVITDWDADASEGIAVTGLDTTCGAWQYSTNGGESWFAMGAVSDNSARLLSSDAQTRIRFIPADGYEGMLIKGITLRAWDQTSGVNGDLADTSDNGGTTAFSYATHTATVRVLLHNRAPVLNSSGGQMRLDSILIDDVNNAGTLVSTLLACSGGRDRITDPVGQAKEGIAVIAADTANGAWQYSTNGGESWFAMGAVADNSARLLASDAQTRIRFVPAEGFCGQVTDGITFRAWDQTGGVNGDMADTSANGGFTAFSTATRTADAVVGWVLRVDAKHRQQFMNPYGSLVTVSMTGAGTSTLFFAGTGHVSADHMDISGTNARSKVTITCPGGTMLGDITVTDGSLGSLIAGDVELAGDVSVFGTLGTLTLSNLLPGPHTIETRIGGAGDAKAQLTMTLGVVVDTVVDTHGQPIKTLSTRHWLDTDSFTESITAPWLGQLTTGGGFGANLVLDDNQHGGTQTSPKTLLSKATIKGDMQFGDWHVAGAVGSIVVTGAISNWTFGDSDAPLASLKALTAGQVGTVSLFVKHAIGSVKAVFWKNGKIDAGSLGKLTITGQAATPFAPAVSGDVDASIRLTRSGIFKATGLTLGSAIISGNLSSRSWEIVGHMGALTVGGTAGRTAGSPLTVRASGSIASLTLGAAIHVDFWAGMDRLVLMEGEDRHAVSGQTVFDNSAAAIKHVTVKGWKMTPTQTFFQDSNFSAPSIGTSSLLNVETDPDSPCGFWAKSLVTISRKDSTLSPAKTYKSTSDLFALDGLNILPLA